MEAWRSGTTAERHLQAAAPRRRLAGLRAAAGSWRAAATAGPIDRARRLAAARWVATRALAHACLSAWAGRTGWSLPPFRA